MSDDLLARTLAAVPTTGRVEVVGDDSIASALRSELASRCTEGRPEVVIETSGTSESITDAIERVEDDGTVILAGPPLAGDVELNLYTDLHARGLTLVGITRTG